MNKSHQFFAAAFSLAFVAGGARAQAQGSGSSDEGDLPLASLAAGSSIAPSTIPAAGTQFIVRTVEASAYATRYTLERAGDRARIGIEIPAREAAGRPLAEGQMVVAGAVSTGVVFSADGQPVAFVPNSLGRYVRART